MRTTDLASLALFIRVAETGSITKAATAFHIALAAASRRITQMEDQYGVKLLHRTARGVQLTPAGTALLFHSRQLMGAVDQMRAELSDYTHGTKGMVRMWANASALAQYLPEDLATFATRHPAIKVTLEEERSGAIVEAVHAGRTDVGIVMEGADTTGLECRPYRADTLGAVVPLKHPIRAKRLAFEKLLDQDFVGLESNTVISQLMLAQAAKAGKPLRLRIQVKSFDVVARMVQAGLGIGLLPEEATRAYARSMGLRVVSLTDPWAARSMSICYRHFSKLPAAARMLVEHLAAAAAPKPPA